MKRFILHVGFHKTATSSIQQTLADNQVQLKKLGFYYPIFKNGDQNIINHSIPFYSAFCDRPDLYHINIRAGNQIDIDALNLNYIAQFNEVLKSNDNVIISGEDISVLPQKALMDIRNRIVAAGFKLEVYCSVRRPYSLICSELAEIIKNGTATLKNITVSNRSGLVEKLQTTFSKEMFFFNFENDCVNKGPVYAFLERIGIRTDNVTLINSNEGFGNLSTRVLAHLNLQFPIIKNGLLYEKRRKNFTSSVDKEKFLLTNEEFESIKNKIEFENSKYGSLLGNDFKDTSIDFSKPINLKIEEAVNVYNNYSESHTSISLLRFINANSKFSLYLMCDFFHDNAEVLRNIAVVLEKDDIEHALKAMSQAKLIRPNGPLINKKIKDYEAILISK